MSQALSLQPLNISVPGVDLDAYLRSVNSIPVLSAKEEQALAERFFYHQDLEAARQLVIANLRFVVYIAKSYSGYGLPQADLIQEGNVGLMKAVKRFDPEKGFRLVSFAVHWIKAEIHEFVLRNWRIVKIATTKAQRKLFFNLRGAKKRLALLTREEAESVAQDLNVSVKDVLEMEGRLSAHDMAFDLPTDSDEDNYQAPAYFLEDRHSDPAELVEQQTQGEAEHASLHEALQGLDDRSRDILAQRWLADKKATLHELADKYQVSAERIRQLEKNAMAKLKAAMQEIGLEELSY